MTLKRNQIIGLSILIAGSLFFVAMGTIMLQSSRMEISDLTVIEGKVEIIEIVEIKTGRAGATRPALSFRLKGVDTPLAISNLNETEIDRYLHDIHTGDVIRAAYDASASLGSNEINFAIYELEKVGGKKLVRMKDVKKQDLIVALVLYALSLLMVLIFVYIYHQKHEKNRQ